MLQTLVLGNPIQCTDGAGGQIVRIILNQHSSRMEYLIARSSDSREDHFVPVGVIGMVTPQGVNLNIDTAQLQALPAVEMCPERRGEGTIRSNVVDLCVAGSATPVQDAGGTLLGHFQGVAVNDLYQVVRVLLQDDNPSGIPIVGLTDLQDEGITVQLASEAAA